MARKGLRAKEKRKREASGERAGVGWLHVFLLTVGTCPASERGIRAVRAAGSWQQLECAVTRELV